ncbi:MAG: glycosyltransferase family A protein [Saprospiraceae bacterium]
MISIIIPTYNRCIYLKRTLESLFLQNISFELFEIIIVDNGSTDETSELVNRYVVENQGTRIYYFYDSQPGLLTGRHRGANEAKGDILCFIDDDVELSPGWLSGIYESFERYPEVSLVTGPVLPKYEVYPPEWVNYFFSKTPYGGKECSWLSLIDLGELEHVIDPNYVWGLNFSIRKSDLIELNGFHPDNIPKLYQMFQGDGESGLTMKALKLGKKALYNPDVLLYHQIPASRLTYEYFDKRAFYQGICNSFTNLRDDFFEQDRSLTNIRKVNFFMKLENIIVNKIKHSKVPPEIKKLFVRFKEKHIEGYEFHQKSFYENTMVKDWVLRNNYWDYKLPRHD